MVVPWMLRGSSMCLDMLWKMMTILQTVNVNPLKRGYRIPNSDSDWAQTQTGIEGWVLMNSTVASAVRVVESPIYVDGRLHEKFSF